MTPKHSVNPKASQTYALFQSAHNTVETVSDARIISPPMVGVPCFFKWVSGPSERIG